MMEWTALTLPKRPYTDKIPVPPHEENLPEGGLPMWQRLSMDAKLPHPWCPPNVVTFVKPAVGESVVRSYPSKQFEYKDNYNRYPPGHYYDSLNDPYMRDYFRATQHYHRMLHRGFITKDGKVKCTLPEFNQYRVYLHKLYALEVSQLRRLQIFAEKQRLAGKLPPHPVHHCTPQDAHELATHLLERDLKQTPKVGGTKEVVSAEELQILTGDVENFPEDSENMEWIAYQRKLRNDYQERYAMIRNWLNHETNYLRNIARIEVAAREKRYTKRLKRFHLLCERGWQLLAAESKIREDDYRERKVNQEKRYKELQKQWEADSRKLHKRKIMRRAMLSKKLGKAKIQHRSPDGESEVAGDEVFKSSWDLKSSIKSLASEFEERDVASGKTASTGVSGTPRQLSAEASEIKEHHGRKRQKTPYDSSKYRKKRLHFSKDIPLGSEAQASKKIRTDDFSSSTTIDIPGVTWTDTDVSPTTQALSRLVLTDPDYLAQSVSVEPEDTMSPSPDEHMDYSSSDEKSGMFIPIGVSSKGFEQRFRQKGPLHSTFLPDKCKTDMDLRSEYEDSDLMSTSELDMYIDEISAVQDILGSDIPLEDLQDEIEAKVKISSEWPGVASDKTSSHSDLSYHKPLVQPHEGTVEPESDAVLKQEEIASFKPTVKTADDIPETDVKGTYGEFKGSSRKSLDASDVETIRQIKPEKLQISPVTEISRESQFLDESCLYDSDHKQTFATESSVQNRDSRENDSIKDTTEAYRSQEIIEGEIKSEQDLPCRSSEDIVKAEKTSSFRDESTGKDSSTNSSASTEILHELEAVGETIYLPDELKTEKLVIKEDDEHNLTEETMTKISVDEDRHKNINLEMDRTPEEQQESYLSPIAVDIDTLISDIAEAQQSLRSESELTIEETVMHDRETKPDDKVIDCEPSPELEPEHVVSERDENRSALQTVRMMTTETPKHKDERSEELDNIQEHSSEDIDSGTIQAEAQQSLRSESELTIEETVMHGRERNKTKPDDKVMDYEPSPELEPEHVVSERDENRSALQTVRMMTTETPKHKDERSELDNIQEHSLEDIDSGTIQAEAQQSLRSESELTIEETVMHGRERKKTKPDDKVMDCEPSPELEPEHVVSERDESRSALQTVRMMTTETPKHKDERPEELDNIQEHSSEDIDSGTIQITLHRDKDDATVRAEYAMTSEDADLRREMLPQLSDAETGISVSPQVLDISQTMMETDEQLQISENTYGLPAADKKLEETAEECVPEDLDSAVVSLALERAKDEAPATGYRMTIEEITTELDLPMSSSKLDAPQTFPVVEVQISEYTNEHPAADKKLEETAKECALEDLDSAAGSLALEKAKDEAPEVEYRMTVAEDSNLCGEMSFGLDEAEVRPPVSTPEVDVPQTMPEVEVQISEYIYEQPIIEKKLEETAEKYSLVDLDSAAESLVLERAKDEAPATEYRMTIEEITNEVGLTKSSSKSDAPQTFPVVEVQISEYTYGQPAADKELAETAGEYALEDLDSAAVSFALERIKDEGPEVEYRMTVEEDSNLCGEMSFRLDEAEVGPPVSTPEVDVPQTMPEVEAQISEYICGQPIIEKKLEETAEKYSLEDLDSAAVSLVLEKAKDESPEVEYRMTVEEDSNLYGEMSFRFDEAGVGPPVSTPEVDVPQTMPEVEVQISEYIYGQPIIEKKLQETAEKYSLVDLDSASVSLVLERAKDEAPATEYRMTIEEITTEVGLTKSSSKIDAPQTFPVVEVQISEYTYGQPATDKKLEETAEEYALEDLDSAAVSLALERVKDEAPEVGYRMTVEEDSNLCGEISFGLELPVSFPGLDAHQIVPEVQVHISEHVDDHAENEEKPKDTQEEYSLKAVSSIEFDRAKDEGVVRDEHRMTSEEDSVRRFEMLLIHKEAEEGLPILSPRLELSHCTSETDDGQLVFETKDVEIIPKLASSKGSPSASEFEVDITHFDTVVAEPESETEYFVSGSKETSISDNSPRVSFISPSPNYEFLSEISNKSTSENKIESHSQLSWDALGEYVFPEPCERTRVRQRPRKEFDPTESLFRGRKSALKRTFNRISVDICDIESPTHITFDEGASAQKIPLLAPFAADDNLDFISAMPTYTSTFKSTENTMSEDHIYRYLSQTVRLPDTEKDLTEESVRQSIEAEEDSEISRQDAAKEKALCDSPFAADDNLNFISAMPTYTSTLKSTENTVSEDHIYTYLSQTVRLPDTEKDLTEESVRQSVEAAEDSEISREDAANENALCDSPFAADDNLNFISAMPTYASTLKSTENTVSEDHIYRYLSQTVRLPDTEKDLTEESVRQSVEAAEDSEISRQDAAKEKALCDSPFAADDNLNFISAMPTYTSTLKSTENTVSEDHIYTYFSQTVRLPDTEKDLTEESVRQPVEAAEDSEISRQDAAKEKALCDSPFAADDNLNFISAMPTYSLTLKSTENTVSEDHISTYLSQTVRLPDSEKDLTEESVRQSVEAAEDSEISRQDAAKEKALCDSPFAADDNLNFISAMPTYSSTLKWTENTVSEDHISTYLSQTVRLPDSEKDLTKESVRPFTEAAEDSEISKDTAREKALCDSPLENSDKPTETVLIHEPRVETFEPQKDHKTEEESAITYQETDFHSSSPSYKNLTNFFKDKTSNYITDVNLPLTTGSLKEKHDAGIKYEQKKVVERPTESVSSNLMFIWTSPTYTETKDFDKDRVIEQSKVEPVSPVDFISSKETQKDEKKVVEFPEGFVCEVKHLECIKEPESAVRRDWSPEKDFDLSEKMDIPVSPMTSFIEENDADKIINELQFTSQFPSYRKDADHTSLLLSKYDIGKLIPQHLLAFSEMYDEEEETKKHKPFESEEALFATGMLDEGEYYSKDTEMMESVEKGDLQEKYGKEKIVRQDRLVDLSFIYDLPTYSGLSKSGRGLFKRNDGTVFKPHLFEFGIDRKEVYGSEQITRYTPEFYPVKKRWLTEKCEVDRDGDEIFQLVGNIDSRKRRDLATQAHEIRDDADDLRETKASSLNGKKKPAVLSRESSVSLTASDSSQKQAIERLQNLRQMLEMPETGVESEFDDKKQSDHGKWHHQIKTLIKFHTGELGNLFRESAQLVADRSSELEVKAGSSHDFVSGGSSASLLTAEQDLCDAMDRYFNEIGEESSGDEREFSQFFKAYKEELTRLRSEISVLSTDEDREYVTPSSYVVKQKAIKTPSSKRDVISEVDKDSYHDGTMDSVGSTSLGTVSPGEVSSRITVTSRLTDDEKEIYYTEQREKILENLSDLEQLYQQMKQRSGDVQLTSVKYFSREPDMDEQVDVLSERDYETDTQEGSTESVKEPARTDFLEYLARKYRRYDLELVYLENQHKNLGDGGMTKGIMVRSQDYHDDHLRTGTGRSSEEDDDEQRNTWLERLARKRRSESSYLHYFEVFENARKKGKYKISKKKTDEDDNYPTSDVFSDGEEGESEAWVETITKKYRLKNQEPYSLISKFRRPLKKHFDEKSKEDSEKGSFVLEGKSCQDLAEIEMSPVINLGKFNKEEWSLLGIDRNTQESTEDQYYDLSYDKEKFNHLISEAILQHQRFLRDLICDQKFQSPEHNRNGSNGNERFKKQKHELTLEKSAKEQFDMLTKCQYIYFIYSEPQYKSAHPDKAKVMLDSYYQKFEPTVQRVQMITEKDTEDLTEGNRIRKAGRLPKLLERITARDAKASPSIRMPLFQPDAQLLPYQFVLRKDGNMEPSESTELSFTYSNSKYHKECFAKVKSIATSESEFLEKLIENIQVAYRTEKDERGRTLGYDIGEKPMKDPFNLAKDAAKHKPLPEELKSIGRSKIEIRKHIHELQLETGPKKSIFGGIREPISGKNIDFTYSEPQHRSTCLDVAQLLSHPCFQNFEMVLLMAQMKSTKYSETIKEDAGLVEFAQHQTPLEGTDGDEGVSRRNIPRDPGRKPPSSTGDLFHFKAKVEMAVPSEINFTYSIPKYDSGSDTKLKAIMTSESEFLRKLIQGIKAETKYETIGSLEDIISDYGITEPTKESFVIVETVAGQYKNDVRNVFLGEKVPTPDQFMADGISLHDLGDYESRHEDLFFTYSSTTYSKDDFLKPQRAMIYFSEVFQTVLADLRLQTAEEEKFQTKFITYQDDKTHSDLKKKERLPKMERTSPIISVPRSILHSTEDMKHEEKSLIETKGVPELSTLVNQPMKQISSGALDNHNISSKDLFFAYSYPEYSKDNFEKLRSAPIYCSESFQVIFRQLRLRISEEVSPQDEYCKYQGGKIYLDLEKPKLPPTMEIPVLSVPQSPFSGIGEYEDEEKVISCKEMPPLSTLVNQLIHGRISLHTSGDYKVDSRDLYFTYSRPEYSKEDFRKLQCAVVCCSESFQSAFADLLQASQGERETSQDEDTAYQGERIHFVPEKQKLVSHKTDTLPPALSAPKQILSSVTKCKDKVKSVVLPEEVTALSALTDQLTQDEVSLHSLCDYEISSRDLYFAYSSPAYSKDSFRESQVALIYDSEAFQTTMRDILLLIEEAGREIPHYEFVAHQDHKIDISFGEQALPPKFEIPTVVSSVTKSVLSSSEIYEDVKRADYGLGMDLKRLENLAFVHSPSLYSKQHFEHFDSVLHHDSRKHLNVFQSERSQTEFRGIQIEKLHEEDILEQKTSLLSDSRRITGSELSFIYSVPKYSKVRFYEVKEIVPFDQTSVESITYSFPIRKGKPQDEEEKHAFSALCQSQLEETASFGERKKLSAVEEKQALFSTLIQSQLEETVPSGEKLKLPAVEEKQASFSILSQSQLEETVLFDETKKLPAVEEKQASFSILSQSQLEETVLFDETKKLPAVEEKQYVTEGEKVVSDIAVSVSQQIQQKFLPAKKEPPSSSKDREAVVLSLDKAPGSQEGWSLEKVKEEGEDKSNVPHWQISTEVLEKLPQSEESPVLDFKSESYKSLPVSELQAIIANFNFLYSVPLRKDVRAESMNGILMADSEVFQNFLKKSVGSAQDNEINQQYLVQEVEEKPLITISFEAFPTGQKKYERDVRTEAYSFAQLSGMEGGLCFVYPTPVLMDLRPERVKDVALKSEPSEKFSEAFTFTQDFSGSHEIECQPLTKQQHEEYLRERFEMPQQMIRGKEVKLPGVKGTPSSKQPVFPLGVRILDETDKVPLRFGEEKPLRIKEEMSSSDGYDSRKLHERKRDDTISSSDGNMRSKIEKVEFPLLKRHTEKDDETPFGVEIPHDECSIYESLIPLSSENIGFMYSVPVLRTKDMDKMKSIMLSNSDNLENMILQLRTTPLVYRAKTDEEISLRNLESLSEVTSYEYKRMESGKTVGKSLSRIEGEKKPVRQTEEIVLSLAREMLPLKEEIRHRTTHPIPSREDVVPLITRQEVPLGKETTALALPPVEREMVQQHDSADETSFSSETELCFVYSRPLFSTEYDEQVKKIMPLDNDTFQELISNLEVQTTRRDLAKNYAGRFRGTRRATAPGSVPFKETRSPTVPLAAVPFEETRGPAASGTVSFGETWCPIRAEGNIQEEPGQRYARKLEPKMTKEVRPYSATPESGIFGHKVRRIQDERVSEFKYEHEGILAMSEVKQDSLDGGTLFRERFVKEQLIFPLRPQYTQAEDSAREHAPVFEYEKKGLLTMASLRMDKTGEGTLSTDTLVKERDLLPRGSHDPEDISKFHRETEGLVQMTSARPDRLGEGTLLTDSFVEEKNLLSKDSEYTELEQS